MDHAKEKCIELVDFESVFNVLKANVVLFPLIQELVKLVKIVLCMLGCTFTAERSFSGILRLTKKTVSPRRILKLYEIKY